MNEAVTFRFIMEEGKESDKAPAAEAQRPQAAAQPIPESQREAKAVRAVPFLFDSGQPGQKGDNDGDDEGKERKRSPGWRYREAQQMISGISRGAYFASHFGLAGAVGAAGQFLEAGQSAAVLAGASQGGISKIAGPLGVAIAALGAFTLAVKGSSDAVMGMAERHKAFSGEVAVAVAQQAVAKTRLEIEQARRYSKVEARAVRARAKADREMTRTYDAFTAWLADNVSTPIVNGFAQTLKEFNEWKGLSKQQTDAQVEREIRQAAGFDLLQGAINKLVQFNDVPNPAAIWMKNNRHFEVADLQDMAFSVEEHTMEAEKMLPFDPFRGAIAR